ncbi:MAG: S8 family serine peptidase [Oligoflexia bacterium]|nr:S8 family serine peptidase [Oligoflexia bacterium]
MSAPRIASLLPALLLAQAVAAPALERPNEPYESLQWGLHNPLRAQTVELDFMTTRWVPARPGEDLHLPASPAPAEGEKILVAVLDTGIDKTHPDLAGRIHRNESECRALAKFEACLGTSSREQCEKIWFDFANPEVDQDKNGYPLDCQGWSLLGGLSKVTRILGRPDFGDDQGHGTHVAGIIGADPGNGVGVRGCSAQVELLPVQVIGKAPSEPVKPLSVDLEPSEGKRRQPQELSDLVARGVIYAIRSGARVLNFSLGWPASKDSETMRALIAEAQSRGIVVVAAAGNDSTGALLEPCGYPGVLCVGAHGPDGAISHFSNFGSGVDLAAPGLNILSTWPMDKRPVRFRNETGYEFLHGTSQAAPHVSCLAAELLARGYSSEETYARLVAGARPSQEPLEFGSGGPHERDEAPATAPRIRENDREKYVLSGNADLERSLGLAPRPLILPVEKHRIPIRWDRRSPTLAVPFNLKNRWAKSDLPVEVTAEVLSPSPSAARPKLEALSASAEGPWASGESRLFEARLRIVDTEEPGNSRIPSELELLVRVRTGDEPPRAFIVRAEILVPVDRDYGGAEARHLPIVNLPRARTSIFPVDTILDTPVDAPIFHDYVLIEYGTEQWNLHLLAQDRAGPAFDGAYRLSGTARVKAPAPTEAAREQIFARVDLDFDGRSEYVVGIVDEKDEGPSPLTFLYFDAALRPLFTQINDGKLAEAPYDVNGMQVQWMKSRTRRVPSWIGYGLDPYRKPRLRDRWTAPGSSPARERPELRFYYLDEDNRIQALQKHGEYKIVDLLNPTQEQALAGRVPVLLARDRGHENASSYLLDFARAEVESGRIVNFRAIELFARGLPYRNLLDTIVDPVLSTDSRGERYNGTFWAGGSTPGRQRLSLLRSAEDSFSDYLLGALRGESDAALLVRAAYSGRDGDAAFVLTNSEIQFHDLSRRQAVRASLERYTFFQDDLTNSLQMPLVVDDSLRPRGKLPALYTPESSRFSRGVRVRVPSYDTEGRLIELLTPAKLRYESEKDCRPLDTPLGFGAGQPYAFDYFCRDKLIRVPLVY